MKQKDLKQVISGCRNNDRRSQKALYDQFYGYALSVALIYCNRETEVREVLNDAFLKVFMNIGHYDCDKPFTAWLRTIVVRTAINYYHKYLQIPEAMDLSTDLDVCVEDNYLSQIAADELAAQVQKLPPAYRLALNLFAIEGHTHAEIAEMLGISIGASKSNVAKARAKLKQMLTNELINGN